MLHGDSEVPIWATKADDDNGDGDDDEEEEDEDEGEDVLCRCRAKAISLLASATLITESWVTFLVRDLLLIGLLGEIVF